MSACKKEDPQATNPGSGPNGELEIDLSKSENSALASVGGSLIKDNAIIAQPEQDVFIALAVACTHQGTSIIYIHNGKKFRCPNHGSEFDRDGKVLVGPATVALKKFTVTKNGSILKIS